MSKHLLSLVTLVLAGCDVIGEGGNPTVAEVQANSVRCGFLPTRETAEKIIAARPMQSDQTIAAQICAAVKAQRRGAVAGVAIEGLTVR